MEWWRGKHSNNRTQKEDMRTEHVRETFYLSLCVPVCVYMCVRAPVCVCVCVCVCASVCVSAHFTGCVSFNDCVAGLCLCAKFNHFYTPDTAIRQHTTQ